MGFFKDQASQLRAPPDASKLGLSEDEYEKRKKEASKMYKVKKEKGTLGVESSAKAQQEFTKGTAHKIVEQRRGEIKKKYSVFNKVRWTVFFICSACFVGLVYEVLWPVTKLHWSRYERMRRRHEEVFLPAMKRLEEERLKAVEEG